jgi:coiled-coil and C2 domain-containing protein 2A
LRVDRDKTKPVTNPQNCHIIAQIVRGHNVPVRRSRGDFGAGQTQAQAQAQELNTLSPGAGNVRVFVEVYFQGHVKRTMVSRGTNPHWDELLALPFIPPGGSFFPGALQQVRDRVYFNVFDEVTTVLEEDYRLKHTHVRKTEHRWLGQFSVPFTTIYMNGRVEGLFTVEVPIMHLGYEKPQPSRPTQLWVYLTLDPVLVTPPPDNDAEKWRHRSAFFEHCVQWEESVRALPHCRTRNLASLVNDINGQPRLVCRYVAPQAPPDGMTLNMYPRFVSMVPFEEDWQQTGGAQDVWCTADEFLTLGAGDWEEHALLLCNYFKHYESTTLAQGWHTYVAIGHGIPEGKTAYVLRIHEQDGIIDQELVWNPVTGECYNIRNEAEACPLVSIGCVFDERDVWANVQPSAEPARINFYFENLNYWRPLFNRQFSRGEFLRRTLQTPVNYFRVPEDHFVDRAQRIERAVERQFERWRRLQTRWNYGVSHILRDMLQEFEGLRQNGKLAAAEENRDLIKLRQIYDTMYGFPLSFADTGEDDMLEVAPHNPVVRAVFNTRIHENEDPAAEFALGVYIYPYYPNRVASIWVYIAVLSSSHPLA